MTNILQFPPRPDMSDYRMSQGVADMGAFFAESNSASWRTQATYWMDEAEQLAKDLEKAQKALKAAQREIMTLNAESLMERLVRKAKRRKK